MAKFKDMNSFIRQGRKPVARWTSADMAAPAAPAVEPVTANAGNGTGQPPVQHVSLNDRMNAAIRNAKYTGGRIR